MRCRFPSIISITNQATRTWRLFKTAWEALCARASPHPPGRSFSDPGFCSGLRKAPSVCRHSGQHRWLLKGLLVLFCREKDPGVAVKWFLQRAAETFPTPQYKAASVSPALPRPTWRAQVTHKFVTIDTMGQPRLPGRPEQAGTTTEPLLPPAKVRFLHPPVPPACGLSSMAPRTCSSPPILGLRFPFLRHLPLPVFSFPILL